jgi:N-acetylglucosaminyl-diphospho-decaprenol L-rhamnosyltransferase
MAGASCYHHAVRVVVVIPTLNGRDLLARALESLESQTGPGEVVVADNGSFDGTSELVAERFPEVRVVRFEENLGFGRAINRALEGVDADLLVLVNNDVVCEPDFVARICAPLERADVGMVAGVLTQQAAPELIDTAGIELDPTLRSWDYLWNRPLAELGGAIAPLGPCGGAAAYRLEEFRRLGGFDERLFAYWEDVDLAIRFRESGWSCALAPTARAAHRHGGTFGAATLRQRTLDAFGRGFVLGRYAPLRRRPLARLAALLTDLALLVRKPDRRAVLGARRRGLRAGTGAGGPELSRSPVEVSLREALGRHLRVLRLSLRGELPQHFASGD